MSAPRGYPIFGMRRLAAIDIGTNSVKLSVLELRGGRPHSVREEVVVTRLGEGVNARRRLLPQAIRRTLRVVRRFRRAADALDAPVRIIATEAIRRARNRALLIDALGAPVTILTRRTEARMSFLGARTFLRAPDSLMVDLGGGTIEILVARNGRLVRSATLPLGCVYLTEQFLATDPPLPSELRALEEHIEQRLNRLDLPPSRALVGIGGSVATVAFALSRRKTFDTESFNGASIAASILERLYRDWSRVTCRERIRRFRVDPQRADIILAAMAVLRALVRRAGARRIVVCTYGVRHGVLLSELGGAVY